MAGTATREQLLEQILQLPLEDREYIESELMRGAYEAGARAEPPAVMEEIRRRAKQALATPGEGLSLDDTMAHVRATVAAARARRP